MIETTRRQGLDALLAQRDLGDYPPFKQFGNRVMSVWATLWAGIPLPDVESGYRIFRLGALADALDYYRGYKYSETVEVAVVLSRLGYRVRNDFLVPVPVFRSRTSMHRRSHRSRRSSRGLVAGHASSVAAGGLRRAGRRRRRTVVGASLAGSSGLRDAAPAEQGR